jgi:hypothetical protein
MWAAGWTITPSFVDSAPAMVAIKSIFNGCVRLVSANVVSEAVAVHAHNAASIAAIAVFFIFFSFLIPGTGESDGVVSPVPHELRCFVAIERLCLLKLSWHPRAVKFS